MLTRDRQVRKGQSTRKARAVSGHTLLIALPLTIITAFSLGYMQISSHTKRCNPTTKPALTATQSIAPAQPAVNTDIDNATHLSVVEATPNSVNNLSNLPAPASSPTTTPDPRNTVTHPPAISPSASNKPPVAPARPEHLQALKSLLLTNLNL